MAKARTRRIKETFYFLSNANVQRRVWSAKWRFNHGVGLLKTGDMPDSPKFIHLRLHTEYSLLEGAVRLKKLPGMAAKAGMPAVAVTDTNNMFAALEFSVAAQARGAADHRLSGRSGLRSGCSRRGAARSRAAGSVGADEAGI